MQLPTKAHPPTVQFNPGLGPFLRVQALEHHPVPVRDGASPPWWEGIGGPRVTVVLHTTLSWRVQGADSHAKAQLRAFLAGFADAGWDGMFTGGGLLPASGAKSSTSSSTARSRGVPRAVHSAIPAGGAPRRALAAGWAARTFATSA